MNNRLPTSAATTNLGPAGSIDYRVFYGNMPISTHSGASDYFNIDAPFPNLAISIDSAIGGTFFWNAPLEGLRVGYSFSRFRDFTTVRYVPFRGMDAYKTARHYDRHLVSMEYVTGSWLFAAEYGWENPYFDVAYPPAPAAVFLDARNTCYYLAASRRVTERVELGAYYGRYDFSQVGYNTPLVFPDLKQGDYALSVRFDVTDHLILKVEGHYMDGAGQVFDVPSFPQPVADRDKSWTLFAAKATVFF